MTASKPATPPFSADAYGATDFAKVDAHEVAPHEYDALPELTDDMVARADVHEGGTLVRRGRGRPPNENRKRQVTLRLPPAVIEGYQASGPGWQVRMGEVLAAGLGAGRWAAGVTLDATRGVSTAASKPSRPTSTEAPAAGPPSMSIRPPSTTRDTGSRSKPKRPMTA